MTVHSFKNSPERQQSFLRSLDEFSKDHRAAHWSGTFGEFLENIVPANAEGIGRSSHEYVWDMIRSKSHVDDDGRFRCTLFEEELFGIDETLERLVDYFKAASAGSEVGRRLLLLLGPPSGGKSSLVILLKRGIEEYSRTEAGALYA
ncbi:MAG: serine protein kinase, partial [Burkholderiales bacterium]|nr:serine protein kinase [Burkholderiales bacterium]